MNRAHRYSSRAHQVHERQRQVDRVLERANAAGRTRIRCQWCSHAIERGAIGVSIDGGPYWVTDDGRAECPGRVGDGWNGHEPAAAA